MLTVMLIVLVSLVVVALSCGLLYVHSVYKRYNVVQRSLFEAVFMLVKWTPKNFFPKLYVKLFIPKLCVKLFLK